MRTKTERIGNAWRGCLHGIVQRDTWIKMLLSAAITNLVFAVWVMVKYGPYIGVMVALISHVMCMGVRILMR